MTYYEMTTTTSGSQSGLLVGHTDFRMYIKIIWAESRYNHILILFAA
jgi:hypothetical protein